MEGEKLSQLQTELTEIKGTERVYVADGMESKYLQLNKLQEKLEVVQTTGTDEHAVMSQKATTEKLSELEQTLGKYPELQPNFSYKLDDFISYKGKVYSANKNFTSNESFNPSDWVLSSALADINYRLKRTDLNVFNISKLYPTGGVEGTDVYTLSTAIEKVPGNARYKGIIVIFNDGVSIKQYIYNGKSYSQAASWDDISKAQVLDMNKKLNIINDYFSRNGYINKSNGAYTPYNQLKSTNMIAINRNQDILWHGRISLADQSTPLAFYDKNLQFVSAYDKSQLTETGYGDFSGDIVIRKSEIPSQALYFACSAKLDNAYIIFGKVSDDEEIYNRISNNEAYNYNFVKGKYLRYDGTLPLSNEHYYTGYQRIDKERPIRIVVVINKNDQSTPLAFYDVNYRFISAYDKSGIATTGLTTIIIAKDKIPQNACYYRVGSYRGSIKEWSYNNEALAEQLNGNTISNYPTIRECLQDKKRNVCLVGSQLVQHNNDDFIQPSNIFSDGNKVTKQFNYIGLNGKLPELKKEGYVQTFTIDNVTAKIIAISKNYIYLQKGSEFYRAEYILGIDKITKDNSKAVKVNINCNGEEITNIIELNDLNLLVETKDASEISSVLKRKVYKVTLTKDDNVINSVTAFKFKCADNAQIWSDWSIDQYENIVVIAPYGMGVTAQVWVSTDYGENFKCIFNVANDTTFVATRPNENSGLGSKGKYPLGPELTPKQDSNFWEIPSEANGNIHIHSIRYDNVYNRIYITLGDYFSKTKLIGYSAIYYTDDLGLHWFYDYIETQCLTMIPMQNVLLAGTDGRGHGIFRYSRGRKNILPPFELAYQEDEVSTDLDAIGNATALDGDLGFMVMCPNSSGTIPSYTPYGNIVCTDGYNFKKIYIDQFADGTKENCKIQWHITMIAKKGNIFIKYRDGEGLLVLENIY